MTENQVADLLDGDVEELSAKEQRSQIEELLEFDSLTPDETPPNPCSSSHEYWNPGIDIYCNHLSWGENGWEPIDDTTVLQKQVPEYLPTDSAIQTILKYSPILEIGAGSGYWSAVIDEAGGEIIATDYLPPNVPYDNLPDGYMNAVGTQEHQFLPLEREEEESFQKVWHTIHIADHSCVQSYPSHAILLCHPPVAEWTEELLGYCHLGQELVLVSEWFPGADGTPLFFNCLLENWELVERFPVYDWSSMHTGGYVFKKVDTE